MNSGAPASAIDLPSAGRAISLGLLLNQADLVQSSVSDFEEAHLVTIGDLNLPFDSESSTPVCLQSLLSRDLSMLAVSLLRPNRSKISRCSWMLAGVYLDAVEVHEAKILPDRLDVLGNGIKDRLLELAGELETARTQDVDVRRRRSVGRSRCLA